MKPYLLLSLVLFFACSKESDQASDVIHADWIKTDVDIFGHYEVVKLPISNREVIWNPIQIARDVDGNMYVANTDGRIFRLEDTDGDGWEDLAVEFCNIAGQGLRSPAGLAFLGNDMYVGTAQEIRVYRDISGNGIADTSFVFFDQIPQSEHPYEWTSALTFDASNNLYAVLTTDSWNAGASEDPLGLRGSLLKINQNGSFEVMATGLRSVSGSVFTESGSFLFIDNEGGGNPTEELNLLEKGKFYGHNPDKYNSPNVTDPVKALKFDVAPSAIVRNPNGNDFDGTSGDYFVSYYGPGERWTRGGISRLKINETPNGLEIDEIPVLRNLPKISDIEFGKNGDLYAIHIGKTDYWYQSIGVREGDIYRIVYNPEVEPAIYTEEESKEINLTSIDRGKELFDLRACSACHQVDGKTELLGPNLKYVSLAYTREELLEEIKNPQRTVKPSMAPTRIKKTSGEILMGRVVSSATESIRLMVVGNKIIEIPRKEIESQEVVVESMMYSGLIDDLSESDHSALLDYLESLADIPG